MPTDFDFYTVSTSANASRDNWPPSEWLEREEWNIPTLVDNRANAVGSAFGLTFFPFSVFVDSSGVVLGRLSGSIPPEEIINIAGQIFQ